MQISLRSQLIAGTAAVVGGSAIAMTPVVAPLTLPSVQVPTGAAVALAALDSPLGQLSLTLIQTGAYVFNNDLSPLVAANWEGAGFGQGSPELPGALAAPALGGYSAVGLIPQIIDDALPIISQLGYNGSGYLNATVTALGAGGNALFQGLYTTVGLVLQGDFAGALTALQTAIVTPLSLLLAAGVYVGGSVIANASAVLNAVVGLVPQVIGVTIAQLATVVGAVGNVVNNVITATSFENGWNAAVDGLFGPTGVPGVINNLTIGAGVQTGPITPDAGVAEVFVPSVRTEVQAGVKVIAGALSYLPPAPGVAAAKSARSAAAARSAAVAEAPAVEAAPAAPVAADNDGAAEAASASEAPAPKPVKHREARKTAARG